MGKKEFSPSKEIHRKRSAKPRQTNKRKERENHTPRRNKINDKEFTITELPTAITITGILPSRALPDYQNQVNRSHQNEAASIIAQIQTTIAFYTDKFGVLPTSVIELYNISAIMTSDGTDGRLTNLVNTETWTIYFTNALLLKGTPSGN